MTSSRSRALAVAGARSLRSTLIPATILITLVALAAGCGGDSGSSGSVSIYADSGPKGASELVQGDSASGSQNQRIPITRSGSPTIVYREPVRELTEGMHLRAIASVTLTKCAITDYMPNARADTACQGTRRYTYDPVEIESTFKIVGGDSSGPDLSGKSQDLGPTKKTTCTTAIHHCSISQDFEIDYSSKDAKSGLDPADARYIVFEVSAASPRAKGCRPPRATDCNVLAVETQKGQAMYWVQAEAGLNPPKAPPRDTSADAKQLDVLTDRGDKNDVRRVVYSQALGSSSDLDGLEGGQFEIDSLLKIDEKLPQAPDIAGYLVLADSPTSISGRYLISDSYSSSKTGNEGGNCDTSCEQSRPAVVTSLLSCDVSAGRRYVNLVADASRAAAKKGETVQVAEGGYVQITRSYSASESVDTDSGVTSC